MGDVILVSSEKRDIGKTVIAVKTAIDLNKSGKNVLLLDLSSGKKKISEYLNVSENIIYDIKDVLDETCSYEQAAINVQNNLTILPYPRISNKLGNIKRESFSKLISLLKNEYDFVIIDADNLSACHYMDFENINGTVIVDCNDFSSIKDINIELDIAEKFDLKNKIVIINKYNKKGASKGIMLSRKEIKGMIGRDVTGFIDENEKYNNADSYFLFNDDNNTFNNIVETVIKAF